MTTGVDPDGFRRLVEVRRSCRAFLPEPLTAAELEALLCTAQRAPSWCNTQPWQLIVTSGQATDEFRSALLRHVDESERHPPAPDFPKPVGYSGKRLDRRRASGWALYEAVGVARGDRAASARQARENYAFFGAPHFALVTTPAELGTYGALDCGLYVATFLYAAESLGLGAIAQAAIANHAPFVRDYFDIPEDHLVLCGIPFGRRDEDHPANSFRTTRAPLDESVRWVGGPA
ncbi:MAG TPA: nitroreductase [Amycolatopsis sp.]|nr:nitroreductase [Amycolatopsis sp.]